MRRFWPPVSAWKCIRRSSSGVEVAESGSSEVGIDVGVRRSTWRELERPLDSVLCGSDLVAAYALLVEAVALDAMIRTTRS